MDPISHLTFAGALGSLAGTRIAPAGSPCGRRGLAAAFVLGGLSPDLDVLVMPSGWDRYLVAHEFATHSLAGTLAPAAGTALVVMGLAGRRGHAGYRALFLGAWIGALSHLLLDVVSGGTLRLFWPLIETRVRLPLFAMADLLLIVPLALYLLVRWTGALAPRRLAAITMMAIAVLAGVKAVSYAAARQATARLVPDGELRAIESEWGTFTRWQLFDRRGAVLRAWSVQTWPAGATLRFTRVIDADSPEIAASRRLATVRNFSSLFALRFARVSHDGDQATVLWSDIRLCDPERCALWFGGRLDAALRPLEQIVLVGGLRQQRSVAEE